MLRLVFQFVFIPWLQEELDQYIARFNDRKPRLNRKKVLPHGRPSDIFENPRKFGSEDFSVSLHVIFTTTCKILNKIRFG